MTHQDNQGKIGPRGHAAACRAPILGLALVTALVLSANVAVAQTGPAELNVHRSRTTGLATFVTAADGGVIPVPAVKGKARLEPRDFLAHRGQLFGITDVDRELRFNKAEVCLLNRTCTTYDQVHEGVRVFSGVIKVHQSAAGEFVAANGDFYPIAPKLSTTPALSAEEAEGIVAGVMAPHQPTIEHSELVIVDPGWYGDAMRGAHLSYYIMASDWTVPASEAFFVEAQTGEVLDRWNLICTMKDRAIYDFTGFSGPWSLPGNLVRSEGVDPSCCAEDVNRAYDYFGDVYDYYYRAFGRDGIDGKGLTMLATVYYYDPTGIIF